MEQNQQIFPASTSSATIFTGDITVPQQIIASSVGALLTSLVVTPMDVVKIRLQSQARPLVEGECFLFSNGLMDHLCRVCGNRAANGVIGTEQCEWFNRPGHFTGTLDAFVKIARHEGVRSLWSGLSPTMLSAIPATVFYFTLYDNLLCAFRDRMGNRMHVPLMAGALARTAAVSVVSPLELFRTKMQSERLTYREMKSAVRRTIKFDGYSALWRGWSATIMRDIPFSAIYWTLYEYCKQRMLQFVHRQKTTFGVSFACGAFSGSVAAILTSPFDVVKTHQQITLGQIEAKRRLMNGIGNGNGSGGGGNGSATASAAYKTFAAMRELIRAKGVSALFTGVVPRVARVSPACAIMIGSYEELKLIFARQNKAQSTQRNFDVKNSTIY